MEALGKDPLRRNFVVRMRCAFTPSVRSILRCSNFKVTSCVVLSRNDKIRYSINTSLSYTSICSSDFHLEQKHQKVICKYCVQPYLNMPYSNVV